MISTTRPWPLLLLIAAASPLAIAPAAARPAEQAATNAVIPFVSAEVDSSGETPLIRWTAPGAKRVRIYAGTDPDAIARSKPVASGGTSGEVRVTGLAVGRRWFFALVPDRGAPLVIADHALHLATAPNLRDIGGYRTTDGRWVRMGMVYRSDQLDRLSEQDLATVGGLGIALVADLRTASERAREPDRLPTGSEPLVLDVAADSQSGLGGDMRGAFKMIAEGKAAEMLITGNREFVGLDSARRAYHTLVSRIATGNTGATLYHCTAGKDRTGWASAVILTLLGVPRETVMADYLASNRYLAAKNEATFAVLAKMPQPIPRERVEPALTVRADYIDAAFAEVDRRYGSFDRYVSEGLGLDDTAVAALKARLLVGVPEGMARLR